MISREQLEKNQVTIYIITLLLAGIYRIEFSGVSK